MPPIRTHTHDYSRFLRSIFGSLAPYHTDTFQNSTNTVDKQNNLPPFHHFSEVFRSVDRTAKHRVDLPVDVEDDIDERDDER